MSQVATDARGSGINALRLAMGALCALVFATTSPRPAAAATPGQLTQARAQMDEAAEKECALQAELMERDMDFTHRFGSNMTRSMKSKQFGQCMAAITPNLDIMFDMIENNRIPNVNAVFDECRRQAGDPKTLRQREDWRKPAIIALFAICMHSHGRR